MSDQQTSYAPCGEGGAVGSSDHFDSRKCVMVFYSPGSYDRDLSLASINRDFFQRTMEVAIEVCLRLNWRPLFNLLSFGTCIVEEVGEPYGFTGIRGMAVVPIPLPTDEVALPYGIIGPSGQVVVAPIKLARSDEPRPLFPRLPRAHKELCLIFGVPLVLAEI